MGVSFLSTVPSFVNINNLPRLSHTALHHTGVNVIRCSKIETGDVSGESSVFHRREVLKFAGAAVGMELVGGFTDFVGNANAADLIQLKQRSELQSKIKAAFSTALKGKPELIPSILTLALNDAMTYDKATKSGGPNGSVRFSSEISRPENQGLSAALSLIEEVKKDIDSLSKGGPVSYADLIQYAGQAAVKSTFLASAIRKCGGKEDKGMLLYTAYGSNGQWGLFDKQLGRSDTIEPDPEGRIPQWDKASVQEMKDKFVAVGLGPRQLAVMSAFLGSDQAATEALLATDPQVEPWVQKYQRSRETVSQTDYEVLSISDTNKDMKTLEFIALQCGSLQVDLITTLTKLSTLGQKINYEAYSYPVERIDLKKLKL